MIKIQNNNKINKLHIKIFGNVLNYLIMVKLNYLIVSN